MKISLANYDKLDVNMYWNTKSPMTSDLLPDPHAGIEVVSVSHNGGFVHCTFNRDAITDITTAYNTSATFDLIEQSYYLLLATGNVDDDGRIKHHTLEDSTSCAVNLGSYSHVKSASNLLFKLHGVAMLLAWLLFSNIGIVMARYFKGNFQVSSTE